MVMKYVARPVLGLLLMGSVISCSAQTGGGALATGMTSDQATSAMGQPDLKDSVTDPSTGATVSRYTWVNAGKSATFNSDNRVASVQDIGPAPTQQTASQGTQQVQQANDFDPIATPLGYLFWPVKAAAYYLGAGVNCVGGGGCHMPTVPPPTRG